MSRFNYDDRVRVMAGVDQRWRPGAVAWIVGVFEDRPSGSYFEHFPQGVVYSIEYEDGASTEVHEDALEPLD